MLVGVWGTVKFFVKRNKIKGSLVFFAGFLWIVIGFTGFTIIGFLLQLYGAFLLFRSFIKTIFSYMQTFPVVGGFLRKTPFIHKLVDYVSSDVTKKDKAEV